MPKKKYKNQKIKFKKIIDENCKFKLNSILMFSKIKKLKIKLLIPKEIVFKFKLSLMFNPTKKRKRKNKKVEIKL